MVLIPSGKATDSLPRASQVRWDVTTGRLIDRREINYQYRDFLRILADGRHVSDRETLLDTVTGRRQTVAMAPAKQQATRPTPPPSFCTAGFAIAASASPRFAPGSSPRR